jgi:hypothetical protein
MAHVWHVFQGCGWASWVCLLFGVVGIWVGFAAIIASVLRVRWRKGAAWAALSFAMLPITFGTAGVISGKSKVDDAIAGPGISPEQREYIRTIGYEEANQCVVVGGALSGVPLVISVGALLLAFVLPPRTPQAASRGKAD